MSKVSENSDVNRTYKANIRRTYKDLRSLYLGIEAMGSGKLFSGKVTVLLEDNEEFSVEGTLNSEGFLTGMAKLYHKLDLKENSTISFKVSADGNIVITDPKPTKLEETKPHTRKTVFTREFLKHIHIEPFRPENLNTWEPETETDVYLAFGVLQDFTDFQYCCGASTPLLAKLGYKQREDTSKPDAILVSRITGEYLMGEWKMKSSHFKSNHKPDDVDVLVCWIDDESNRETLPIEVLALQVIAKKAVEKNLEESI